MMSIVGTNVLMLSRFTLVFQTSLFFVVPIVFHTFKILDLRLLYLGISLACFVYSNYFGSFSVYLKKTELFIVSPMQMLYFGLLASFTIYLLFHYTQKKDMLE